MEVESFFVATVNGIDDLQCLVLAVSLETSSGS